ncbi:MAG: hypothetical protein ACOH2M_10750 [Cypionkella sp.]
MRAMLEWQSCPADHDNRTTGGALARPNPVNPCFTLSPWFSQLLPVKMQL